MLRLLLALVTLIAILMAGILLLLENPDSYKAQVTDAIESGTGYQVKLDGGIRWRYWPPIALELDTLSVGIPGADSPFASIERAAVDLDLLPLLQQSSVLHVNTISLAGVDVKLLVRQDGSSNWEPEASDAGADEKREASGTETGTAIGNLNIERLNLRYVDERRGIHYTVTLPSLAVRQTDPGNSFSVVASMLVRDESAERQFELEGNGKFVYMAEPERLGFSDLSVHLTDLDLTARDGGTGLPTMKINLAGTWWGDDNLLSFSRADFLTDGMTISMPMDISMGGDLVKVDGALNINADDFEYLESYFDTESQVTGLTLSSLVTGDLNQLNFTGIEAQARYGKGFSSTLTGKIKLTLAPQLMVTADLRIDSLDLDVLASAENDVDKSGATGTSAADETGSAKFTATFEDTEIVPLDALQDILTDSMLNIDRLLYGGHTFEKVRLRLRNDTSKLEIDGSATGMGGKLLLSVNSQPGGQATTQVTTGIRLSFDDLDAIQLSEFQGVKGKVQGSSELTFTGRTMSDLASSITGKSTFYILDGTLDVRPLKQLASAIDTLRGKRSSISDWPDLIPFERMAGEHVFRQGFDTSQVFNFDVENLSVTGQGGFDLVNESINYDVTAMMTSATGGAFKVSEQLAGIRWPMKCVGKWSDTLEELCLGQENAIANLVVDVLKQEIKRQAKNRLLALFEDKITGLGFGNKKPADGSDEKPADGSDEKPADGSDEKPADGSDENSADGSDEKPADGSDEKPADGSDEKPADGSDDLRGVRTKKLLDKLFQGR